MVIVAPALRKKHSLAERTFGALLLRSEIYDEVKRDSEATTQGLVLVLLAQLLYIWPWLQNPYRLGYGLVILVTWPFATAWFFMWAKYVFARGTTWDMADWLLRTLALSYAPRLLFALQMFVPWSLFWPLSIAIYIWQLVMIIVALRHGLQISIGRAIWVLLGTVLMTSLMLFVGFLAFRVVVRMIS
jgi:hypothetical protein